MPERLEPLQQPFIVWVNYGCEGWKPTGYATLDEAVQHESFGSAKLVTRLVHWVPVEVCKE